VDLWNRKWTKNRIWRSFPLRRKVNIVHKGCMEVSALDRLFKKKGGLEVMMGVAGMVLFYIISYLGLDP
jgi:hypothetical protein